MKSLITSALFCFTAPIMLQAEPWFHESFDVSPDTETLGKYNGWQANFNNDGPSAIPISKAFNYSQASPFPSSGSAIQPLNSKQTSHRILDRELNGNRVYFSFVLKPYRTEGTATLRFRSATGGVVSVGMIDGDFAAKAFGDLNKLEPLEAKQVYFIAGYAEFNEDGKVFTIQANHYTDASDVDPAEPDDWEVSAKRSVGKDQLWNAVAFNLASSSAVFDDLRLGDTWTDVATEE